MIKKQNRLVHPNLRWLLFGFLGAAAIVAAPAVSAAGGDEGEAEGVPATKEQLARLWATPDPCLNPGQSDHANAKVPDFGDVQTVRCAADLGRNEHAIELIFESGHVVRVGDAAVVTELAGEAAEHGNGEHGPPDNAGRPETTVAVVGPDNANRGDTVARDLINEIRGG